MMHMTPYLLYTSAVHVWQLLWFTNTSKSLWGRFSLLPVGGALFTFLILYIDLHDNIVRLPLIGGKMRTNTVCVLCLKCLCSIVCIAQTSPAAVHHSCHIEGSIVWRSQPVFHLQTHTGHTAQTPVHTGNAPLPVYLPLFSTPPGLRVKFTQLTAVLRNVWKLIPGVNTSPCVCAT